MLNGGEIRYLRERLDMTQKEFEVLLGVAPTDGKRGNKIRKWEEGIIIPSYPFLRHMRTLVAVSNSLLAFKIERPWAAQQLLEGVFRVSGAVIRDEQEIGKR